MKYAIAVILAIASLVGAWFLLPSGIQDECCEWVGLIAPDGVSEVAGVEHEKTIAAAEDGSIPAAVPGLRLNDPAGEVALPALDGASRRVDFAATPLTVLVFVSCDCPTSKIYEERLGKLAAEFEGRVQFVGLASSAQETRDELAAHFGRTDPKGLNIPVLHDEGNVLADRFGARVATETFVFDREGRLQYRGAVDNARNPLRVTNQYLRGVLEALLAGRQPQWRYQPANGC
ncbi:MAG: redoxin family protein [Planctomycetes bacterium]|nr:redoxin family protein [Planctomycetota bacterium]